MMEVILWKNTIKDKYKKEERTMSLQNTHEDSCKECQSSYKLKTMKNYYLNICDCHNFPLSDITPPLLSFNKA